MKKQGALLILAVVMIAAVYLAVNTWASPNDETKQLQSIEIRDYNGTKLSSIYDFRENSISGPQYINNETYELTITGLVNNTKVYTYQDVLSNYQHYVKVATLQCVDGWRVNILWEGVLVKDLIQDAGALPEAKVVIFKAYDGYSTSFPIEYLTDSNILLASKMNGLTLPPERGFPFQLVAESKWGYKWIKWVTVIELSNDTSYRGYWESRGFSNEGNLH